jgi:diguanylate cyclase (GGDEF)-like protein/PAS domain S-box-containing protein
LDTAIDILIVEDDPADAELASRELERAGLPHRSVRVDSADAFRSELARSRPDIILSDFSLPGFDGAAALAIAQEQGCDAPFIFVSGTIGEERAIHSLKCGATDYVLKSNLARLPPAIRRALKESADDRRRRQAERDLAETKERLDGILSSLENVVWSLSADTHELLYLNSAVAAVYGRPAADFFADRSLWDSMIHPEDRRRVTGMLPQLLNADAMTIEYRIVRPDGTVRWLEDRARVVRDAAGQPIRYDGVSRDVTDRREYEARIEYLANYDAVTGLPNRNLLDDRIAQALIHAQRAGNFLAVLFVDLDHFKLVNDSFGHASGDALLMAVAHRLRATLREGDTLARLGGDEFVAILVDLPDGDAAASVARKLLDALSLPFQIAGRIVHVAASIGIAMFPGDADTREVLLRNADTAMYRAKERGRSRYEFHSPEQSAVAYERANLRFGLRRALECRELEVYYQPQVDLRTGSVRGVEALVRWHHPERGMILPGEFIPLAEDTGLIDALGEWVLRSACHQARAWQDRGRPGLTVSVNVSPRQMQYQDVPQLARQALRESGLSPQCLELELTEGALIRDAALATETLEALKSMGVRVSLDDFGTGYSSLSYLKRFPIRILKLDRAFVIDVARAAKDASIAEAIFLMARALDMQVVAEGVESVDQLRFLRSRGCHLMQGYYFSPPLAVGECGALLDEDRHL